jgi:hypothetical protein
VINIYRARRIQYSASRIIKHIMQSRLFLKTIFVSLFATGTILASSANAFGQMLEVYENIGTLRTLKGQIMDPNDGFIPAIDIQIKQKDSEKEFSLVTDEDGVFLDENLPPGEYTIKVAASGFNPTEITVKIDPNDYTASDKYILIRLSPGCASGGSVELGDKVEEAP